MREQVVKEQFGRRECEDLQIKRILEEDKRCFSTLKLNPILKNVFLAPNIYSSLIIVPQIGFSSLFL
jgi:hypothetical protein